MKVAELLQLSGGILKTLHETGVKMKDYDYLPLYMDYLRMLNLGEKTTYIIATLSERYGMCERKVYQIVRRMKKDCKITCS